MKKEETKRKDRDDPKRELFQMGEVTKALGITRRMLIHYEELGLVTPAVKHNNHGFRYYTADNIVHIRLIRTLQNLGLSLAEIKSYFDNSGNLGEQIERLVQLRNQLDQHIARLRNRQADISRKEIRNISLPAFTAYCRLFSQVDDLEEKKNALRQTYIDTIRTYSLDIENKMCTQISIESDREGMYLVPVLPGSKGEAIVNFPPIASALCIYYRGPYENFSEIYQMLLEYAERHGMTPHGFFRNIYMEGPPTHGAAKENYLTQIVLPIKFMELNPQPREQ